jgi:hypothetical protein
VKQQYKGSYTFDVATRTITMLGIEVPPERVLLVVNSTVGFVYHNFAIEPNGDISISGGNTVIVFPPYKDCDTHRNADALSIFYDDGVDLGKLIKDESDQTQTLVQLEFNETQTLLSVFKDEVKAEFDETQDIIEPRLESIDTVLTAFKAEAKTESDATQVILDNLYTKVSDFKTEAKSESDDTQTILTTKLPNPVNGRIPVETIGAFDATNGVSIAMDHGAFGPIQVRFSRSGSVVKTLNLIYDIDGKLTSVLPA